MSEVSRKNQFQCDHCKRIINKLDENLWSEKQRIAEHIDRFGFDPDMVETADLCDDCDKEFMAWFNTLSEEERKKMKREALGE